jgi:hypothetical protein
MTINEFCCGESCFVRNPRGRSLSISAPGSGEVSRAVPPPSSFQRLAQTLALVD